MLIAGLLGKGTLNKNYINKAYTAPDDARYINTDIILNNPTSSNVSVSIWVGNNTLPAPIDFIEKNAIIVSDGRLERSCVLVGPYESIFISADSDNVDYRIVGVDDQIGLYTQWSVSGKSATLQVERSKPLTTITQTRTIVTTDDKIFSVDKDIDIGTTDPFGFLTYIYTPSVPINVDRADVWTYQEGQPINHQIFTFDATKNILL